MLTATQLQCCRANRVVLELPQWQCLPGQFGVLLGPNGAGKSTLFAALAGQLPVRGEVLLHGVPLSQWTRRQLACHLAVLPQSSVISLPFTAREVVGLGLIPLRINRTQGQTLVQACMRRVGCEQLSDRLFTALSGGEQQRVQLARVLVQLAQAEQPALLLLDEPVSAQDIAQQHAVLQLARSLAHGHGWGVLAILHDINLAARYSDVVSILCDGRLLVSGAPADCLTVDIVEQGWGYRPDLLRSANGHPVLI